MPLLQLSHVSKLYQVGNTQVVGIRDINLSIDRGEFVFIVGPSGSGKSTLLTILGCLDVADSGHYRFENKMISEANERELADIRNKKIGFVFQAFNLIPRLSALRNVEIPMIYGGLPKEVRIRRAMISLKALRLEDRMHHTPMQLSGGQQQRVTLARALVNNPDVIIADEPTGSLDVESTHEVMQIFQGLHKAGKTIVFVTHDINLARYGSRVLVLRNGTIIKDHPLSHSV